jgi:hypothetical protein
MMILRSGRARAMHAGMLLAVLAGTAATARGGTGLISGKIQYTGRTGLEADAGSYKEFASRNVKVEIWDKNSDGTDVLIGSGVTDSDGNYSIIVPLADTDTTPPDTANVIDPYVKVYTTTPDRTPGYLTVRKAGPRVGTLEPVLGDIWDHSTAHTDNMAVATINHTFGQGTANSVDRAFAVYDSFQDVVNHHLGLPGSAAGHIDVSYPTPMSTSNFSSGHLHILEGDRYDWDVNGHEYGHYVSSLYGMEDSPGGKHSSRNNLRFSRGAGGDDLGSVLSRDRADKLAWGEGWATYFGISGNIDEGVDGLDVQRAGDTIYNDNDDANGTGQGLRYGIESRHVGATPSRGEDNEASVSRILLDLADTTNDADDHDRVSLGFGTLHALLDTNNVTSMTGLWSALEGQAGVTGNDLIDYGAIFMRHNAASTPSITSVHGDVFDPTAPGTPTFGWSVPLGGQTSTGFATALFHDFKLIVVDSLGASVFDSGWLGDVTTYSPMTSMPLAWVTLLANNQEENLRWVVASRETTTETDTGGSTFSYTSGGYWSDALSFYVIPAPSGVAALGLLALGAARRRR